MTASVRLVVAAVRAPDSAIVVVPLPEAPDRFSNPLVSCTVSVYVSPASGRTSLTPTDTLVVLACRTATLVGLNCTSGAERSAI